MHSEQLFILDGAPSHFEICSNKRVRLWCMGPCGYTVCLTGISYYILQADTHRDVAGEYIESHFTATGGRINYVEELF